MLMGVVDKPTVKMYWSTKEFVSTPIFGKTMSRDRFMLISRYLHFADNTTADAADKLRKIRPLYDMITTAFHSVCDPGEHISIDEALLRFFGRLGFKTYIANKPAKYGMKSYKVCDPLGYTYKFQLYTGASTDTEENSEYKGVVKVVMELMKDYLGNYHRLWMDNWYNSPELFLLLLQNKVYAAGTLRLNRRGVPSELKKKKKRNKGM